MSSYKVSIRTNSAEETKNVGESLGKLLIAGDVVAFSGDLGAGKTCMIQGVARGLQVPENCYVRSPSFIILNIYAGRYSLNHFDLYRIQAFEELEDLGYRDFFYGDGVTVIEWAEKIHGLLPENYLKITIDFFNENSREIIIEPLGKGFVKRWEAIDRIFGNDTV